MKNINVEITNKKEKFQKFLLEPDQAELTEVRKLCEEYPYVKDLWFLYARLCFINKNAEAKMIYQKAALFSSNPEELHDFVYSPQKELNKVEYIDTEDFIKDKDSENFFNQDLKSTTPASTNKNNIQHLLSNKVDKEESSPSRYIDDWMPYSYVWWLQKTRMEYAETYQPYATNTAENRNQPKIKGDDINHLDQQIREHIFHLQSPEEKLSEQFGGKAKPFQVPQKSNPIIEKFIKEEPQIKPPTAEKINLENKARKSAEDNSGFVSETLAKIYTEQGLYHKALDTYKKLSLKYPEKSLYFADRIKELNQKFN